MRQLASFLQELTNLAAVGFPIAALVVWGLAVRRRKRMPERLAWRRSLLDIGVVLAVLPVLMVTMWPSSRSGGASIDLIPGADLGPVLAGETSMWPLLGNFLILIPLGALIPLRSAPLRRPRLLFGAAAAIALLTEATQAVFALTVTLDSAAAKTAGMLLGAGMTYYWWGTRNRDTTATSRAAATEPTTA
ncbi:hypothetical protein CFN78_03260 [Amycolatopsis antarctica]|uniref:VanZ-like domain-containing protein n=1 Tax=Amycolatopsis antarctica TaxID=1854586 RepID=A0A263D9I8_9PSEU|nr:VanZ family protein [Amycolatopsis antarctica]OZM75192.1 hypothetical protein CFN78_03260 [Amycolatopsis antarctica]